VKIREVTEWDDLRSPGDWLRTKRQRGDEYEFAGIVFVCVCGEKISLSVNRHIFESLDPLSISPSIGHFDSVKRGTYKCHYFIRKGAYVQA